jgi:hypothetical protein
MSSTGRPALPEHIQHPSDKTLNRIVFALERSLKSLVDVPYLRGNLLEGVALGSATTTLVSHKLGRKIRGWWVCDGTASATIYRDTSSTADLATHLPLFSSAETTVSLWVF